MDWPTLEHAVADLYEIFGRYPRPSRVEGCPHCVGANESATFCRTPLREVTDEMISRYAFKAMTTWGEVDDYKHFLPRILELCARGESGTWPGLEIWLIASKLQLARWEEWSESERFAVKMLFRGAWRSALSRTPQDYDAAEFLQGLVEIEDVAPYLEFWTNDGSATSARQLAHAAHWHCAEVAKVGVVWGARKVDASEALRRNATRFTEWLCDPARRERLLHEFESNCDASWATDIAQACDDLEWLA